MAALLTDIPVAPLLTPGVARMICKLRLFADDMEQRRGHANLVAKVRRHIAELEAALQTPDRTVVVEHGAAMLRKIMDKWPSGNEGD